MYNRRLINNLTNLTLLITLYVQAGNDPRSVYGTLNVELKPGQSKEVAYGDLRNSFLQGVRINPLPVDPLETYYAVVSQRGDNVDYWLNGLDTLDITIERLHVMDSHLPFAQAVREV